MDMLAGNRRGREFEKGVDCLSLYVHCSDPRRREEPHPPSNCVRVVAEQGRFSYAGLASYEVTLMCRAY